MPVAQWILAHGESLQVALFFALLVALAAVETVVPVRPGPMDRSRRWSTNLFFALLNLVALGVLPVSIVSAAFWAERHQWGLLNQVPGPAAVAVGLTLVVRAFISFFTHYLMHRVPLFWRLHRVHHLDTELDVTTTVRFHPVEFVVQTAPAVPIVVGFGLTPWVLVFYEILDVAVTLWTHSNTRLPAGLERVLRYVIVTPSLHRIHHSARVPETNSNYGAVFPLWDLVFGTFRPTARESEQTMRLGLDEVRGRAAQRPLWLLGSMFIDRLDRAPGDLRTGIPRGRPTMIAFRPPRIALTCLTLAAIVDASSGARLRVHVPHVAAGSVLGIAGLSLMLWGWRLFVTAKVAIRPTAETVRLVTHGVYRATRNPMYLGLVLMLLGVAVARGTAPYYVAAVVYFVIIDRIFCGYEEATLTARFGDEYRTYARRVRRWV